MSKKATFTLIGLALVAVGVFMFFKTVRVYSWGFYRIWNDVSTGGIVIALLLLDVVIYVATQNKIAKIMIPVLLALLVLLLILGTHLTFVGSLLDLLLMLVPTAIGAGLLLRAAWWKNEDSN
jgi:hypothetical protein